MANELIDKMVAPYLSEAETLCVLNGREVYVNNDIESMKKNAKDRGVDIIIYKEKVSEVKSEIVDVQTEQPKKSKKK